MLVRGLAVLTLATPLVFALGCSGFDCSGPSKPCPELTIVVEPPGDGDGEISWTYLEEEHGPMSLTPEHPDPTTCSALLRVRPTYTQGCRSYRSGEPVTERAEISFSCPNDYTDDYFSVWNLQFGDLRQIGEGTFSPSAAMVGYAEAGDGPERPSCKGSLAHDCVHLVVEHAVGGAEPYPQVVSDGYRRVMRLELSCTDPVRVPLETDGTPTLCDAYVRFSGQIRFVVDADDYAANPSATIPPGC